MADSNAPWRNRPSQMNPSNSNSPLSPASGGSNPVSFRPNVNRAKTKRWVEAKQYSYDGGDWGSEDEEEEEEEEQPPAPVRPPYATQRTTSSSELSSRRLPGLGLGSEESRASPGVEPKVNLSGSDQKPVFRPADVYKRMQDQQPSQQGVTGALQSGESAPLDSEGPSVSKSTQNSSMGLPEVKRFSGFGTDFFTGTNSNQQTTDPNPDQNALRHNPSQASESSQGFRSVVHQAFDVPETPDSTANSVTRSNSDGTSVISPIMGQRVPADDKTPTIPEEPADSSTPTGVPTENAAEAPFFKPGHRRDMSLPERDNSPSKRPLVTDHETPAAGQAELTSVPPEQEKTSPERPVEAGTQPTIPSTNATEGDFVAPLKLGSAGTSGSEGYRGSIPAIVGANTSPNEADNDRLREEIMRSLSRENSQEPEEQPRPSHYGNPNEDSIPQQYEKYWDNSTGPGEGTPKALASETHPGWASSNTTASQDPYAAPPQAAQPLTSELPQRPKLGRRFSWESSSSADEPAQPIPGSYQSPPDGLAAQEPEPIPDYDDSHLTAQGMTDGEVSGTESQKAERPRLSIVPPVSQNTTPPEQVIPAVKESNLDLSLPDYTRSSTVDESKLQGFRDILQITTLVARIRAFEETRNQFAVLDTGLNHWLQVTLHDQPQHAHLVQESQTLSSGFPKSSPTTRRFPKLTSLGTLSASREDGTPTSASHVRRPSGHIGTIVNRQNVEQRGKEFLHTAGTFGGKAGEAAKGLFAKGRSKFRQGGNDKGQSPSARKSLQFQFSFGSESAKSTGYSGKTPRRNSLNFNSLPVFKFGRSEETTSKFSANDPASIEDSQDESERRGKRFKSNELSDSYGANSAEAGRNEQAGGSGFVTDFAQEMNAALGLSPTETRAQQAQQTASNEPVRSSSPVPLSGPALAVPEPTEVPEQTGDIRSPTREEPFFSADDAEANIYLASLPLGDVQDSQKDLPTPPGEHTDDLASSEAANLPSRSGKEASHTTIPSIRAVSEEDTKPPTPPKDLLVKEPGSADLPPVPMKDLVTEAGNPPQEPQHDGSRNQLAPPQNGHTPRQSSVSTLGEEEGQTTARYSEEEESSPPSPIQSAARDFDDPRPEESVYGEAIPPAQTSRASILPAESAFPGFTPHPAISPSSQEILESKRRSISGLPPSAPGVQSPLRNEVRYSPGTRSSMMSFGSFGRPSTNNSRGTRPNTPGNDFLQQTHSGSATQNGDSKMDKLKSFGRRRRASVGNILTGIQGDLQGALQNDQDKPQKKRGFSRISGFFGRQQESQQSTSPSEQSRKTIQAPSTIKALPTPPWGAHKDGSTEPNGHKASRSSMDKALPVLPAPENGSETARSSLDRPRASISGPPTNSGGSRFYSQLMAGGTQDSPAQHTRSQSQPLMISHPLSPVAPSISEHSSSDSSASWNELTKGESPKESPPVPSKSPVSEERNKTEENPSNHKADAPKSAQDSPTQPILAPGLSVVQGNPESTTQIAESDEPKNIVFSNIHAHPHREGEARTLNERAEPVELPLTRDDSSEEIVMSPTAYPGQEWTPMHYYQ